MKSDTANIHVYGCSLSFTCVKSGYMVYRFVTTESKRANALFILNNPIDFVMKGNRTTSCLIVGLPAKLDSASLLHHFACRLDDER